MTRGWVVFTQVPATPLVMTRIHFQAPVCNNQRPSFTAKFVMEMLWDMRDHNPSKPQPTRNEAEIQERKSHFLEKGLTLYLESLPPSCKKQNKNFVLPPEGKVKL